MNQQPTSILYENSSQTVFLIDIPTSITLAQDLSPTQCQHPNPPPTAEKERKPRKQKHILSTPPLKAPYPSPPEPKTQKARERVLERVPAAEREYHAEVIVPLVERGLAEIWGWFWQEWCFERCVFREGGMDSSGKGSEGSCFRDGDNGFKPCEDHPPVILSPDCDNAFESISELRDVAVKNTSFEPASLVLPYKSKSKATSLAELSSRAFIVPPLSNFLLCELSVPQSDTSLDLIPGLRRSQKFNLILLDPPWPNRSVRRSGHYQTHPYPDIDILTHYFRETFEAHLPHCTSPGDITDQGERQLQSKQSIAAIWVTNASRSRKAAYKAMQSAGLSVCEEWVWIKTTTNGEPITPVDGLWRKPYEILVIGKRDANVGGVTRRVIAAVPDVHSRKPNLRELFEKMFSVGSSYSALEVFARNLTAGWWACGDEVLKFNAKDWLVEG